MWWLSTTMWTMILVFGVWGAYEFWDGNVGEGTGALAAMLLVGVLHFSSFRRIAKRAALTKRLQKNGRKVYGTITAAEQTRSYVDEMPVIKYTVKYSLDGEQYVVEQRDAIPHIHLSSMAVNASVRMLVNPDKPRELVLDL
ncbi:MAG: hypothetical protein ACTHW1_01465 [Ancrocorticia sp.]|uniref:hypothetical protein n=1 Tax=Ancrocorticia sp. TaxID=2593684 RepID=UPI003F903863